MILFLLLQADLAELLDGVDKVGSPGVPGTIAVWGEKAFPVVVDKNRRPIVAAARWGAGRIVAFAHDGYLKDPASKKLLDNALRWCGKDARLVTRAEDGLAEWIRNGGGVVAAQTGWGWQQIAGGLDMRENPLNRLLRPAGIGWTDQYSDTPGLARPDPLCHGMRALDALLAGSKADLASRSATDMVRLLPPDDPAIRKIDALQRAIVPSEKKPLTDPLDRFLLAYQIDAHPDRAHPAAESFPGPVTGKETSRLLRIETSIPGWHSTGLYAAPGKPISVEYPEIADSLRIRIGCHSDRLYHHDKWSRAPEIDREAPIAARISAAFGGLVYVVVPKGCKLGNIPIRISGAVEAPYFVLGETKPDEWKTIRRHGTPWGELATSKVILTVPSAELRKLENPEPLLRFWDRVLDAAADLAQIPRDRSPPQRYVADVQISLGYMHSGYPIMTHLDAAPRMTSLETMKKGDWGLFHELGHNHQADAWTFESTGEVTNNLWTLYILETVCGTRETHEALVERRKNLDVRKWRDDPFVALVMYVQLREAFGWDAFKKVFAGYREGPQPGSDDEKRDEWMVRFSRAIGKNLGPFFEAWGVPTSKKARDSIKDLPRWMPDGFPK
jgi:hypothetical protein